MTYTFDEIFLQIVYLACIAIPILLAITLHEAAHGFAALKLGDNTAYLLGRVTFNPLKHIDLFGTILLPAIMFFLGGIIFGYAKPVPVNFRQLDNPRFGSVLVAAAGPLTNLILAIVSALLFKIIAFYFMPMTNGIYTDILTQVISGLDFSVFFNILLAVFNMIPLPPLDGGRVAVGLLPSFLARPLASIEPYGFFILIFFIFLLPLISEQITGEPINIFSKIILPPVEALHTYIENMVGLKF